MKIRNIIGGILFGAMGMSAASAQATLKDSVVISFNEQTRIIIYGTDRKEIEKLTQYDFNRLIRDVLQKLNTVPDSNGVTRDWMDGALYLRQNELPAEKPEGTGKSRDPESVPPKSSDNSTVIKVTSTFGSEEDTFETDTVRVRQVRHYVRRSPRQGIEVKLGFNTYGKKDWEGYDPENFNLRTGGSRYVSLGLVKSIPVVRGKQSGFFMDLGMDVSWFNLMFEGNQVIRKESNGLLFSAQTNEQGEEVRLKKNKIVSPHINISVMPTVVFRNPVISHVSAGVYGGYRIGGYRKTEAYHGRKSRVASDFYMQDLHYGLALEVGIRCFPDLFMNYDLNNFFEAGKGPQVRMLSFGIRI